MKTNYKTTYILMDRGSEDVALHKELCQAITALLKAKSINSEIDFMRQFPMLHELSYVLRNEIEGE